MVENAIKGSHSWLNNNNSDNNNNNNSILRMDLDGYSFDSYSVSGDPHWCFVWVCPENVETNTDTRQLYHILWHLPSDPYFNIHDHLLFYLTYRIIIIDNNNNNNSDANIFRPNTTLFLQIKIKIKNSYMFRLASSSSMALQPGVGQSLLLLGFHPEGFLVGKCVWVVSL
jgi:hypothetical protein